MNTINTGGPAFPQQDNASGSEGMSLRDYFAASVMSGLLLRDWSHIQNDIEKITVWANAAYAVADSMMKAREA